MSIIATSDSRSFRVDDIDDDLALLDFSFMGLLPYFVVPRADGSLTKVSAAALIAQRMIGRRLFRTEKVFVRGGDLSDLRRANIEMRERK